MSRKRLRPVIEALKSKGFTVKESRITGGTHIRMLVEHDHSEAAGVFFYSFSPSDNRRGLMNLVTQVKNRLLHGRSAHESCN